MIKLLNKRNKLLYLFINLMKQTIYSNSIRLIEIPIYLLNRLPILRSRILNLVLILSMLTCILLDRKIVIIVIRLLNLLFSKFDEHLFHRRTCQAKLYNIFFLVLNATQMLKNKTQMILLHLLNICDFINILMNYLLCCLVNFIQRHTAL